MKITPKKYAIALFDMLLEAKAGERQVLINNFASYLVKNNEDYKLGRIIEEFSVLWDSHHSIVRADVSSAFDLNSDSKKEVGDYIKNKVAAEDIVIKTEVKPEIIGGVIIRYGDKILDTSLKTKLEKLKKNLLES